MVRQDSPQISAMKRKQNIIEMKTYVIKRLANEAGSGVTAHILLPSGRLLKRIFHRHDGMEELWEYIFSQDDVDHFFEAYSNGQRINIEPHWWHDQVDAERVAKGLSLLPPWRQPPRFSEFTKSSEFNVDIANVRI